MLSIVTQVVFEQLDNDDTDHFKKNVQNFLAGYYLTHEQKARADDVIPFLGLKVFPADQVGEPYPNSEFLK